MQAVKKLARRLSRRRRRAAEAALALDGLAAALRGQFEADIVGDREVEALREIELAGSLMEIADNLR